MCIFHYISRKWKKNESLFSQTIFNKSFEVSWFFVGNINLISVENAKIHNYTMVVFKNIYVSVLIKTYAKIWMKFNLVS